MEQPNLWTLKRGTSSISRYVSSAGTHYEDYIHYDNCTLSLLKNVDNEAYIRIGHDPICVECGSEHDTEENINCCHSGRTRCADCGDYIYDEDDEYHVNGETYCRECVSWCASCQEYHRMEEHYIAASDIYVCDDCYDEYYRRCDSCGATYHIDELDDDYLCFDCAEQRASEAEDDEAC
jgi:hypothetical protein